MLNATTLDFQEQLAADPGYLEWMQRDEEERLAALAQEEEARRYPYGRPEQNTGWYWEEPLWGKPS